MPVPKQHTSFLSQTASNMVRQVHQEEQRPFSFEEDENSRSYNEDLDDEGGGSPPRMPRKRQRKKAEEEIEN